MENEEAMIAATGVEALHVKITRRDDLREYVFALGRCFEAAAAALAKADPAARNALVASFAAEEQRESARQHVFSAAAARWAKYALIRGGPAN